jgi:hypothetical protein
MTFEISTREALGARATQGFLFFAGKDSVIRRQLWTAEKPRGRSLSSFSGGHLSQHREAGLALLQVMSQSELILLRNAEDTP